MKKNKIIIESFVLNKISSSDKLTDTDKINFLQYIGYMTKSEKKELIQII